LLDKLLVSGEAPLKLLGGIAFSFRPVAKAIDLVAQGQPLGDALKMSGAKPFALDGLVGYCQRIGRPRWERIGTWLFEADRDLKGASPLSERIVLERLLFRLTAPAPNRRPAGRA
ncbi:MAG: DNA polymerase III subunit delta, partial [Planctomycetaceae bacterium]